MSRARMERRALKKALPRIEREIVRAIGEAVDAMLIGLPLPGEPEQRKDVDTGTIRD